MLPSDWPGWIMMIVIILVVWFLAGIPVALALGKFLRAITDAEEARRPDDDIHE